MKTHITFAMVILMAYPALLAGMIVVDFLLLLPIAFFTGWWWLFIAGIIATAGFVAWRYWMMARLTNEL